jgi:aspartyl-tRNA(Asn)/glutamyl-tRNA(Gln) amidotransferase subunit C
VSEKVMIGKAEVDTISQLSALSVEEKEMEVVAEKLSSILELFSQMEAVDTSDVLPMSHPLDQVQRLREDVVTEVNRREKYQKLAPSSAKNLYLVPQVID